MPGMLSAFALYALHSRVMCEIVCHPFDTVAPRAFEHKTLLFPHGDPIRRRGLAKRPSSCRRGFTSLGKGLTCVSCGVENSIVCTYEIVCHSFNGRQRRYGPRLSRCGDHRSCAGERKAAVKVFIFSVEPTEKADTGRHVVQVRSLDVPPNVHARKSKRSRRRSGRHQFGCQQWGCHVAQGYTMFSASTRCAISPPNSGATSSLALIRALSLAWTPVTLIAHVEEDSDYSHRNASAANSHCQSYPKSTSKDRRSLSGSHRKHRGSPSPGMHHSLSPAPGMHPAHYSPQRSHTPHQYHSHSEEAPLPPSASVHRGRSRSSSIVGSAAPTPKKRKQR